MKSAKINKLINFLKETFGNDLELIDHWPEDSNAIGFVGDKEEFLVYVSGISCDDRYYVALEYPSIDTSLPYYPGKEYNDLELSSVQQIIREHLSMDN